jgi:3-phenylpropionate/trans-cinnamate dioxygenase ferredoxin reductase subunit
MLRLGRKGIPVGCVNGGCGVCKVRVVEGRVEPLGPISRAHVSVEDERRGYTLACRATPVTAVRLEVAGALAKSLSRPGQPVRPGLLPPTASEIQQIKET